MKKLLIILTILVNIWITYGQKYNSKKLNYENCKEFIFKKQNKDSTVYNINSIEFKELVKCKEKKIHTFIYLLNFMYGYTRRNEGSCKTFKK